MAGWWRSIVGGNVVVELVEGDAGGDSEVAGLNFQTALEAHLAWKNRLTGIIEGTNQEVMDPAIACRDDQCMLGKWLYGSGQERFAHHARFQQVVQAHAHFHRCTGHVLELAQAGKQQEAAAEVASGAFARASLEISRHLVRLWHDLGVDSQ